MFNQNLGLKYIAPATYELIQSGQMKVPGLVIATEKLLDNSDIARPLEQVRNVACLPGILGYSIAMPDIHWGYGFPIGGIAATDAQTGVISPGGVGYDINCGVRVAIVPELWKNFNEIQQEALLKELYHLVPSGVGHGQKFDKALSKSDYQNLITQGSRWSIEHGFGFEKDLIHCESYGVISGGDLNVVSEVAQKRGEHQLGSIGSGNHFVEIGEVDEIFLQDIACQWGIEKGLTYVLIHSGSRGFGHQICQDTLDLFLTRGFEKNLPDTQLMSAPLSSVEGKNYFSAMAAAANFAFNNRQHILHSVRRAFKTICSIDPESINLVYDVCHNIAKFEKHTIEGEEKLVCVHRKGATRAYGPNHKELADIFLKTGQPVLVPGDMARASYVLAGQGHPLTWSSCCHGAGRFKSRMKSMKDWKGVHLIEHMEKQGIKVMASSLRTVAEEMPDAYKNVDDVIEAVEQAKLAKKVAKLKPKMVIKG